jgi:biopolymer transport protein ExbD
MADRNIPEINAGSMADIAFLLLIFWLVTTTLDKDLGLRFRLPQDIKPPPGWIPPDVFERNVLNIILNSDDHINIEKVDHELADVTRFVQEFYLSEADNMPIRHRVTEARIADTLNKLSILLKNAEQSATSQAQWYQISRYQGHIKEWEGYRQSRTLLGDFTIMSKRAVIRFQSNNGTSYKAYFSVLDQISAVLRDERNKLAEKHFNITFDHLMKLKDSDPSAREKIRAIRHQLPLKLLEPNPKNF